MCVHVRMYVCVCMYKSLCVCVHMCVCTCVCFTQLWIRISLHKHYAFNLAAFFPRTENQIRGFKDRVFWRCSHPLGSPSALSDLHFPVDSCTWPHGTGLSLGERQPVSVLERCGNVGPWEWACASVCVCLCAVSALLISVEQEACLLRPWFPPSDRRLHIR